MGAVNTTYTFTATDTITSTKMNNIIDQTVMTADALLGGSGGSGGLSIADGKLTISSGAINSSRLASNSVTTDKIVDGTIVNADINASAAIAGTKIVPNFGSQNIVTTGTISTGAGNVVSGSSSNAALRVTQTGTGPALLVEDSTNPDATPLIVDANGDLIIGHTSSLLNGSIEVIGTNVATTRTQLVRYSNDSDACGLFLNKSRSSSIAGTTIVQNGDSLGYVLFRGDDGAAFNTGVTVEALVDGTPGLNDMPGRLVISTASDGNVIPTERVRITSNGNVGIGQTNPEHKLDILDSAGTNNFAFRVKTDGVANDSGIWTDAGNHVSFDARNGSGTLTTSIKSSGSSFITGGSLGIGTVAPNSILHTYGADDVGNFESSTTQAYVKLLTSEGGGNRVEIANRSGGRMALYNPTSGDVVNVLQNGNVGIGKNNPSTRLDVNGTVTATAFSGPLTGNVTGDVTGSSGSCTGNSATATTASTVSNGAITAAKLDGAQSGSAPIYGCRAWVSFAGRSTNGDCTIRSAGNVYRVARTAEGRYTVYFTTAMQDAEYATITGSDANSAHKIAGVFSQAAGEVNIAYSQIQTSTSRIDPTWGQVSIFR